MEACSRTARATRIFSGVGRIAMLFESSEGLQFSMREIVVKAKLQQFCVIAARAIIKIDTSGDVAHTGSAGGSP
jgi:hypothetical protein